MRLSKRDFNLLKPYLVGERPRDDGEIDMYCPLHEDHNRSAQLNVERGVYYCHAGCGGGTVSDLIAEKREWFPPPAEGAVSSRPSRPSRLSGNQAALPDKATVDGWSSALQAHPARSQDFVAERGLNRATLAQYDIGWDQGHEAYTIPIYGADGALLNVRRYQLRPPRGRRKIWGVEGHNEPTLYPVSALREDEVVVCEGELDALITNQHGFPAVTRTGAARVWKAAWNQEFAGKRVFVCHDADSTGSDANIRVAKMLSKVAREVLIVKLPYPVEDKHGKDLTDWWLDHNGDQDAFRRMLEDAQPLQAAARSEEQAEELDDVSVVGSFDATRVGRASRMSVTIKGRHEPGYSVPRRVRLTCTRDVGKKCEDCPLFATGDDRHLIRSNDPIILEMMSAGKKDLDQMVLADYGVPGGKCPAVLSEAEEHQAVEVLFARPSVDHAAEGADSAYKNIKITSVGRHDTMANNTVRVVGALQPNPRSQANEFLAWYVSKMETSLDRYSPTDADIRRMNRFKVKKGETPFKKLMSIARSLSHSVTGIYGRDELHAAIDLVFHSAVSFPFSGKMLQKGWLELMLVGDTRTGKSEAATRLVEHYRSGEVVSCESASFAGIIGGLQQFGSSKEWAITWGAIPLNDRRLVVLDEASGLSPEEIGEMSSVRSSGEAQLTKIQQERTLARTRLVWIANPRVGRMSDYTYGVQALSGLIGKAEDIARFDLAFSLSMGEVPSTEINKARPSRNTRYTAQSCADLVRWCWSRRPEHIIWSRQAEQAVFAAANDLGTRYVEDPPLIQVANVREKVARIAVALAGRVFSTDDGERLLVNPEHVEGAVQVLDMLYGSPSFGYRERSKELIRDREEAEEKARDVKDYLYDRIGLVKFLRRTSSFRRQDLEEVMNIDREHANAIINVLWEARMVRKEKGDIKVEPTLQQVLREIRL